MQISKIAIVGCGLIGGSLGSALRASGFRGGIAGSDASEVLEKAVRLGAIDFAAPTVESAVQDADVIVLATPISSILALLPVVAEHAPVLAYQRGMLEVLSRMKPAAVDDVHHALEVGAVFSP